MIEKKSVDVLLIEDDYLHYAPMVMKLLTDKKKTYFNYCVTHAGLATTAENMLGKKHFDIIILDLHLPDGKGIELVRKIRQLAPKERTAMIVVTGATADDEDVAVREELANDYLDKNELASHEYQLLKVVRNWAIWAVGCRESREQFSPAMDKIEKKIDEGMKVCETIQSDLPHTESKPE